MAKTVNTVGIFTKSYPKDYKWLKLLAATIDKFCVGFEKWYIVLDEGNELPDITMSNIEVEYLFEQLPEQDEAPCPFEGHPELNTAQYNHQQVVKMYWHKYVDKSIDAVVQIDSDCIIKARTYPHSICVLGHPTWIKTAWDEENIQTWGETLEHFLGFIPTHHYMIEPAFFITREATEGFHRFVLRRHGISFKEYAMSNRCTEYNFMGAFIDSNDDDFGYYVIDKAVLTRYCNCVKKYWSWGDDFYQQACEYVGNLLNDSQH